MKKLIIIGIIFLLIAAVILGIFSTGLPLGMVILHNQEESVALSGAEATAVRTLFIFRFYRYGIGGCPFTDGVSITVGNRAFALATDGCYSAKDLQNDDCMEFNRLEWKRIKDLFAKYFEKTLLG